MAVGSLDRYAGRLCCGSLPARPGSRNSEPISVEPGDGAMKHLGFDLKETVEGPGRKAWRINKPIKMPKTARQECRSIAELLDALMERVDEFDDIGSYRH